MIAYKCYVIGEDISMLFCKIVKKEGDKAPVMSFDAANNVVEELVNNGTIQVDKC